MAQAPLSRREKNRLQMRERIQHAATLLFIEKSVEDTAVSEIARAADIAEKTFYNHYPTKVDLLTQLADDMIRRCNALIAAGAEQATNIDDAIVDAYKRLADELEAYPMLARSLINFVLSQSVRHQMPSVSMTFMPVLQVGIKQGCLTDQFTLEFLDRMLTGTHYNVTLHWTNNPDTNLQQQMEHAAAFLLQGASTNAGCAVLTRQNSMKTGGADPRVYEQ